MAQGASERQEMSAPSPARGEILDRLRRGRRSAATPAYVHLCATNGLDELFAAKARAANTVVSRIANAEQAPEAIWAALLEAKAAPRLHLSPVSMLNALPWQRAAGLTIVRERPSGRDASVSEADYGIAETGTLVFLSGPKAPSSWHFLPGHEFVLMPRERILPRFEDVISRVGAVVPATMNLVTGPSRTADIEQTIERGAHGPRELHILLVG